MSDFLCRRNPPKSGFNPSPIIGATMASSTPGVSIRLERKPQSELQNPLGIQHRIGDLSERLIGDVHIGI